eukprot:16437777-Heterocapsa_arctica.AAC.1
MVIINSNEDTLTPIDMIWLSSLITDRLLASSSAEHLSGAEPHRPVANNAPGRWSFIQPTPLTAEMSRLVLGPSGHGYSSHTLNQLYLQQALEGTNVSSSLILSGIRSTKNSPGAIMGRLVRLMVAAGIEELCREVYFEQ